MNFSDADVNMALQDDALLDINLGDHYGPGSADMDSDFADAFMASMIPGVAAIPGLNTANNNNANTNNTNNLHAQPPLQSYSSVEEYAALMGVKLETPQDDVSPTTSMAHLQSSMTSFNMHANAPDPAKVQANTAYFDNLYRERGDGDATSMTLPASMGRPFAGVTPPHANANANSNGNGSRGYDRSTELAFNQMNHRMYDPTSGYTSAAGLLSSPADMQKQPMQAQHRRMTAPHTDLGSQTLSPELLSVMIKNNQAMHNFDNNMTEEEKSAHLKDELNRQRNREHSRVSRLRKKVYIESLKSEVQQSKMFQQICQHSPDLVALVAAGPKPTFMYASPAYGRVLGLKDQHLLPNHTSFLDLVHPNNLTEVRSIFQNLCNEGDNKRFRFRIKSLAGECYDAETTARVAENGIVCFTRVDREI